MEKREKNKNILIRVLVVVILILSGVYVYFAFIKKYNGVVNNNDDKVSLINSELSSAISFAKKDNTKLIAITSEAKEILIYDFALGINVNDKLISAGNFYFDYDNNEKNIYLFFRGKNNDKLLLLIDLKKGNGNYIPEIISEIKLSNAELSGNDAFGGDAYIAKINDNIYFSNKDLYKYDIKSKKYEKTNISSNGRTMWLLKNNLNLIYNDKSDIYVLDTTTNKSTRILPNSRQSYVHNNKLVYYYHDENNDDGKINEETDYSYYLYDFTTGEKKKLTNYFGLEQLDKEYVIPFNDEMYSFNDLTLYKYNGSVIENVYSFTCNDFNNIIEDCTKEKLGIIDNFVKVSSNSLLMNFGVPYNGELYTVEFDLNTKKIIAINDREPGQYLNEYYLK